MQIIVGLKCNFHHVCKWVDVIRFWLAVTGFFEVGGTGWYLGIGWFLLVLQLGFDF